MNTLLGKTFSAGLLLLGPVAVAHAQSSFHLVSPDKRIEVRVRTAEGIRYDVVLDGREVLHDCSLSLNVNHTVLGKEVKVLSSRETHVDDVLTPVVRQKFAKIREDYNGLHIAFDGNFAVDFRAYDEGVAYRFETSLAAQEVKIYDEDGTFRFPRNTTVYYPQEDSFYSHNERLYKPVQLSAILPTFIASLPAVVDIGQGAKLAIAESDLEDYPGLWLKGTRDDALSVTFPPYPLKEQQTSPLDVKVVEAADYIAVTKGTRTYPWRVLGIAEHDADLLTNQLVWLLEKPSQVQDTSWIKPGKVAWDWWNALNVYGVDFKAGINTATYKYFIDFAAKYSLPYIILDEGWSKDDDLFAVNPDVNMGELTSYASQKNVGVILWVSWKALKDQLTAVLDQFLKWGIKGIKVDFMQRSDQPMIDYYHLVSSEAAKRHMLVDFHGDQKPSVMTRTWPNLINTEGVRGMEWSKWSADADPEHNVTIPFTRMFLGPMDYTPGAMRNASKAAFAPIFTRPMSLGTRCQQLAMYVVYEGPLQMLADSPSNYDREPESMQFLAAVPTEWDDSRPLAGKISEYVAIARRNGSDWFVGAMNNWTARDLELDFSFLPEGSFQMDAYKDGENADRMGSDYKLVHIQVNHATKLKIHMAPGGGWTAHIHR